MGSDRVTLSRCMEVGMRGRGRPVATRGGGVEQFVTAAALDRDARYIAVAVHGETDRHDALLAGTAAGGRIDLAAIEVRALTRVK